jgi:hypothetical protein
MFEDRLASKLAGRFMLCTGCRGLGVKNVRSEFRKAVEMFVEFERRAASRNLTTILGEQLGEEKAMHREP